MSTLKEIVFGKDRSFTAIVQTIGGLFEVKGKFIEEYPFSRVEIGEGGKYFIAVEEVSDEQIMNAIEEISDNWWRSWEDGEDIKKIKK